MSTMKKALTGLTPWWTHNGVLTRACPSAEASVSPAPHGAGYVAHVSTVDRRDSMTGEWEVSSGYLSRWERTETAAKRTANKGLVKACRRKVGR